ncbi:hypothetical protein KS872_004518 [Vibrio parahaemolyticus]|uniref:hypothetical protein n=1 Tax=Vibrio parahaemolyticus TaxID=670 RepID=UPI00248FECA2|nr:hypothetical protein [Vibrio parahaemolyticus]EHR0574716.1 hypothetical protein [Vibrio parahaemolyticus]EME0114457.1 hypothetical protein [Vibrio parahaemolyticus]
MKLIVVILFLAVVSATAVVGVFIDKFGIGYWKELGDWALTGDFFGGFLNPIFAFLGLVLVAYTLMQNKVALEQSRKALAVSNSELELSREEHKKSADALVQQAKQSKLQMFESTFFMLLEQHNLQLEKINNVKLRLFPNHAVSTEQQLNEYLDKLFTDKRVVNDLPYIDQLVILLCMQPSVGGLLVILFGIVRGLSPILFCYFIFSNMPIAMMILIVKDM